MEYGLVALWLVTYLVLGAAGLPVAAVLLERLPDRGASVALPLSLTVVTLLALWVGRLTFGWPVLAVGLLVLGALVLAARRRFDADPDWGVAGETAVVFAAAFGLMVAVRAFDPAVHPLFGEKFLDFGLLKSLLRSDTLPPEDMWFAGEPVAYYYGGHLVVALLTKLTGTSANYAYNLALAGYYAMYVTAAYGVGGAISDARGGSRRVGGLAAAFFVGLASNLDVPMMVLLSLLPTDTAMDLARSQTSTGKAAQELLRAANNFGYFGSSRVIEGTINEFPLFAWLNGDLHAHMMSTPFLLLVAALLFAYFRTPEAEVGRRRLLLGAVPLVGGLIGVVNTWSFPAVMGLTALTLLFAPTDPATLLPASVATRVAELAEVETGQGDGDEGVETAHEWFRREVVRVGVAGALAVAVEAVAFLVAVPFFLGPGSTRQLAFLPTRSGFGGLFLVHGAFVLITAIYLGSKSRLDPNWGWPLVLVGTAVLVVLSMLLHVAVVGLFLPLLLGAYLLARRDRDVGFETVLVVGAMGLAMVVEFVYVQEQAGPGRMNTVFKTYAQVWLLWAVAAGGMVGSLIEEYEARAPWAALAGVLVVGALRLHDQGWHIALFAGLAVVVFAWFALEEVDVRAAVQRGTPEATRAVLVNVLLALLVLSTSAYAGLALDAHFAGDSIYARYQTADDPTLDATQFVAQDHPEEAQAIFWMDRNIEGQPNIVTAAPGGYFWVPREGKGASAPSSLTGIPTVLGWFHEQGYRDQGPYRERLRDVRRIYTGDPGEQARLLRTYDVEYVYVGPAERAKYGGLESEITVDELAGVTVYKEWEGVTLYRVEQSKLPANASAS